MAEEKNRQVSSAVRAEDVMRKYKKQSRLGMIWRQYRKNALSMFSLALILILAAMALGADWIAPYGATEQNISDRFMGPCAAHLFGTDGLGRDIFSRVVYGARVSMIVGFISTGVSAFFGIHGAETGINEGVQNVRQQDHNAEYRRDQEYPALYHRVIPVLQSGNQIIA